MKVKDIAHSIRIIAMTAKNTDVMSCEFGNEVHQKFEAIIDKLVCCGNCIHYNCEKRQGDECRLDGEYIDGCDKCEKWEIRE